MYRWLSRAGLPKKLSQLQKNPTYTFVLFVIIALIYTRVAPYWNIFYGSFDDIRTSLLYGESIWKTGIEMSYNQGRWFHIPTLTLWQYANQLHNYVALSLVNVSTLGLAMALPVIVVARRQNLALTVLALLLTFAILPAHFRYTPPASYPVYMLLGVTLGAVAAELWRFARARTVGRKAWQFAAYVVFFVSLCNYEPIALINIALFLFVVLEDFELRDLRKPVDVIGRLWPFATTIAVYSVSYLGFRLLVRDSMHYAGTKVAEDLSVFEWLRVTATLLLHGTSIPQVLSGDRILVRNPELDMQGRVQLDAGLAFWPEALDLNAALLGLAVAGIFWALQRTTPRMSWAALIRLTLFAAAFCLLAVGIYGVIDKYVEWTSGGLRHYIGSRLALPGIGLFLACSFLLTAKRLDRMRLLRAAYGGLGAFAVFVVCAGTTVYNANKSDAAFSQSARWMALNDTMSCPQLSEVLARHPIWSPQFLKEIGSFSVRLGGPTWEGRLADDQNYWERWILEHHGVEAEVLNGRPAQGSANGVFAMRFDKVGTTAARRIYTEFQPIAPGAGTSYGYLAYPAWANLYVRFYHPRKQRWVLLNSEQLSAWDTCSNHIKVLRLPVTEGRPFEVAGSLWELHRSP